MTLPTYLTILRILLAIIFAVFASLPYNWAKITALIIFIIAALTDKVDGYLARKNKQVTDFGAFLDPLADKILVNLAFLILTYQNVIPLFVFAIILVRDFAVDGMRMVMARHKITLPASMLGKIKTTFQILALAILLLTTVIPNEPLIIVGNIILYIALTLTILSGLHYIIKGWKLLTK